MAEKIIITTDAAQKTIENINPAARNNTLAQFGEKIAAFTNGQYLKTDRVFKINCDTEPGGGIKPEPTLELSATSDEWDATSASISALTSNDGVRTVAKITTNSDGQVYTRANFQQGWKGVAAGILLSANMHHLTAMTANLMASELTLPQTIYVGVTETDNFAGKEVAFTITA